jgi:hypothetical protein
MRAPIVWSKILVLENIQSSDLYDKVNEHEESLVATFKWESCNSGETLTAHNLASALRRMGMVPSQTRRANLVTTEEELMEEVAPKDAAESLENRLGDGGRL